MPTVRRMSSQGWISKARRTVGCGLAAVGLLVAGCAAPQGGSAVAARPTFVGAGPASSVTSSPSIQSQSTAGSAETRSATSQADDALAGDWSAVVETGPAGIPSPTGELSAQISEGRVCFVRVAGDQSCGALAPGVTPTFAAFSPDGAHLLVVAGPVNSAAAYVFDPSDASVRVLGPDGVLDWTAGATPPGWDLSSAVWGVDGSSVLLVPRTTLADGPVLAFDLASGAVSQPITLDAALANSSPSLWTSDTGIAVIANRGDQVSTLWWGDFRTGAVNDIGAFKEPGGSLVLSAADPLGRSVLVCPRKADGRLGATSVVTVEGRQGGKLLDDSLSCAGSVFSADGKYLALTAQVDGSYRLLVVETSTGSRVFSVPLPVSEPTTPPYLTWAADVVVASDVSGNWPISSVLVRLQH